jgi:hypothetical protein
VDRGCVGNAVVFDVAIVFHINVGWSTSLHHRQVR